MKRNQRIFLAAFNAVAYLATIIINYLANALPINGQDTGAISDKYYNLFTPAGFTFAIWGVIYLGLGIYIVYQLIESFRLRQNQTSFVDRIGIWFIVSSVANMIWIFLWHHEVLWLSVLVMLMILTSLIVIYQRLNIGLGAPESPEKYLVHLPFSIYLGWISVATIANIAAFLVGIEWGGFGVNPKIWAIVVILVSVGLGLAMIFRRNDILYSAVIAWALFGIYSARNNDADTTSASIEGVIIAGILVLGAAIIWVLYKRETYLQ